MLVRVTGLFSSVLSAVVLGVDPGEVGFDHGFFDSEMNNFFDFFTPDTLPPIPQGIEGGQITSSSTLPSMEYDIDDESLAEMLKALEDDDFSPPAEDNHVEHQIVPELAESENSRICPPNAYRSMIARALARRDPRSPSTRLSTGELHSIIKEVLSVGILFAWSLRERFGLFCKLVNEVQGDVSCASLGFETFVNEAKKERERLRGMAQNVRETLKFDNGIIELLKQAVLINPESSNEQVIYELSVRAARRSPVSLNEEMRKGISTYLDYIRWSLMDESFEGDVVLSSSGELSRKRAKCDEAATPERPPQEIVSRDEGRKARAKKRRVRQPLTGTRHERNQQVFEETLKMRPRKPCLKVLHGVYAKKLHQLHPDIKPMVQATFVRKANEHIEKEKQRIL